VDGFKKFLRRPFEVEDAEHSRSVGRDSVLVPFDIDEPVAQGFNQAVDNS
jgi:hypothetical protein